MTIKHLDHLNLSVTDFAESAAWYQRVFGFELVERGFYNSRPWGVLKAGQAMLCIYEHSARSFIDGEKLAENSIHGVNHFAFRITDKLDWEEKIKQENLTIAYGGAWRWPHSTSWYINDPTGYNIEVVLWDDDKVVF